jgi:hypothetical protein
MGQAMADFVTQMFIALVVANPTAPDGTAMYHSSRGNTTTADISEDSIVDAAVWLRTRKDPDGRPIRSNIRSAVVQNDRPALRIRQAVNSQLTGIVDNDIPTTQMGRGTSNPLASSDLLPADGIVIDPWFPDANDVYYFGDPNRNPAFVAAFLDGQRRPLIGMEDATVMHLSISNGSGHDPYSYLRDTIDYKTRHDVGVTAVEPVSQRDSLAASAIAREHVAAQPTRSSSQQPLVDPIDFLSGASADELVALMREHPDRADAIKAFEEASRGDRARKTVLEFEADPEGEGEGGGEPTGPAAPTGPGAPAA